MPLLLHSVCISPALRSGLVADITGCSPGTPSELLRKAAQLLQSRGWAQGKLHETRTGAVCAVGALYLASNGTTPETGPYPDSLEEGLFRCVQLHLHKTFGMSVTSFNDRKGQTVDTVLAHFEVAARELENNTG